MPALAEVESHDEESTKKFVLSLDDAIGLALRANREIQTAYLQRVAQRFDLYVSEGKFSPKVNLSTNWLNNKLSGVVSNTADVTANATLVLPTGAKFALSKTNGLAGVSSGLDSSSWTLSQPLLKNGGFAVNEASIQMARLDERINQLFLKAVLSQVVTQVIFAYRELFRAQEQQTIAENALARSRALYSVNQALIAAGRMAAVELVQAEAEIANRELALEEASNQVDSLRLALLSLLALESNQPLEVFAPEPFHLKEIKFDEAMGEALNNQPDYLISMLQLERSKINLDYAKNQQLWDLSFVAGRSQARAGGVDASIDQATQKNESSFVGLQLSVALGERSEEQAVVHASVEVESQEIRLKGVRQTVEQRVRDAVRNVQTRWRQLELSNKAQAFSLLKLDAEKEKLRTGRSSNFQVLSFENDLRNAENAKVSAEIAYLNALTDLDERMGRTLMVWGVPVHDAGGGVDGR
jgi:outer membrane protein TolC